MDYDWTNPSSITKEKLPLCKSEKAVQFLQLVVLGVLLVLVVVVLYLWFFRTPGAFGFLFRVCQFPDYCG